MKAKAAQIHSSNVNSYSSQPLFFKNGQSLLPLSQPFFSNNDSVGLYSPPHEGEKPTLTAHYDQPKLTIGQPKDPIALGKSDTLNIHHYADLEKKLQRSKRKGRSIPESIRKEMEFGLGTDFSKKHIHSDSHSVPMNKALRAKAFTNRSDIYFNKGAFRPKSNVRKRLIAHELTNVLQRGAIGQSGIRMNPIIQRQSLTCTALVEASPLVIPNGTAAHSVVTTDFNNRVSGAVNIFIPGASAAPQRTEDGSVIKPQKLGGKAGKGFPDLARLQRGTLEVAELKPATWHWVAEGGIQLGRYVSQGNATDPPQMAWKARNGIKTVVPMSPSTYTPPSVLMVGTIPIVVQWCAPGLIVYKSVAHPPPVPVPVKVPEKKPVRQPVAELIAATAVITALALKKLAKKGIMATPAGRAAAAAALVVLLASGKAEAKIGGGDPVEALFNAMEQNGVKVPDDLRKVIEQDPELKKIVHEAAKKGSLSAAQKQLALDYWNTVDKYKFHFTNKELAVLLELTEHVKNESPKNVQTSLLHLKVKLKKEKKKVKRRIDKLKKKLQKIDKKLIEEVYKEEKYEPVRKLLEWWLSESGRGPKVNNKDLKRLLKVVVSANLTHEEVEKVMELFSSSGKGKEFLEVLELAIKVVRGEMNAEEQVDGHRVPLQEYFRNRQSDIKSIGRRWNKVKENNCAVKIPEGEEFEKMNLDEEFLATIYCKWKLEDCEYEKGYEKVAFLGRGVIKRIDTTKRSFTFVFTKKSNSLVGISGCIRPGLKKEYLKPIEGKYEKGKSRKRRKRRKKK